MKQAHQQIFERFMASCKYTLDQFDKIVNDRKVLQKDYDDRDMLIEDAARTYQSNINLMESITKEAK